MTLRPATIADAPAVVALVNSAYRGESSRAGWTTEADLLDGQRVDVEGLTSTIATAGNIVLVCKDDEGLVGCVHLRQDIDTCHLGMLTIRPAAQGAGLGRQLLAAAERWAIDRWSSRAIEMTVIAQRATLIAWYERRGYRRTGERRPFPYGDPRFGLPRRDDLVFEVLRKLAAG
jgi:ribosomal protein S18 acetylase RimI-like enzyme